MFVIKQHSCFKLLHACCNIYLWTTVKSTGLLHWKNQFFKPLALCRFAGMLGSWAVSKETPWMFSQFVTEVTHGHFSVSNSPLPHVDWEWNQYTCSKAMPSLGKHANSSKKGLLDQPVLGPGTFLLWCVDSSATLMTIWLHLNRFILSRACITPVKAFLAWNHIQSVIVF